VCATGELEHRLWPNSELVPLHAIDSTPQSDEHAEIEYPALPVGLRCAPGQSSSQLATASAARSLIVGVSLVLVTPLARTAAVITVKLHDCRRGGLGAAFGAGRAHQRSMAITVEYVCR
jgi:hypothetical protein